MNESGSKAVNSVHWIETKIPAEPVELAYATLLSEGQQSESDEEDTIHYTKRSPLNAVPPHLSK